MDASKLTQGAHVLANLDLEPWGSTLVQCATTLEPVLLQILPVDLRDQIPETFFSDTHVLLKLAKARLSGDSEAFINTSRELNVSPP